MADSTKYLINIDLQIKNQQLLQKMTRELEKAGKTATKSGAAISKSMKQTAGNTKRFGNVAQNVGYQVQDMAVQIQGGTDVTRALSQQLPQMLVGFGAWGAAIGVVTALLPTLISLMGEQEDETLALSDALDALDTTLGSLNSVMQGIDFTSWNKAWNDAGNSVKSAEIKLLEFRAAVSETDLQKAFEIFSEEGAAGAAADGLDRFTASVLSVFDVFGTEAQLLEQFGRDNFAEYLGITPEAAKDVRELFISFKQNKIELDEFRASLLAAAGEEPTKNFATLIDQVVKLQEAQKKVADTRQQIAAANKALVAGVDLPEGGSDRKTTAESVEATASAAASAAIAMNDYKQMLIEVEIIEEQLLAARIAEEDALKKSAEQYDVLSGVVTTFDRSFETMLNGVLAGTQSLSDGFRDMAKVIIAEILKVAAYQAIIGAFGGASGGGFGQTFAKAVGMQADGNVFSNGNVVPFARGGIVTRPTMFGMGSGGLGVMGEAGPEMIAPVKRMANGQMGVGASPVNVTVNNMASGVSVKTRETENGLTLDVVMEQISASIQKGGNSVANAIENTYSVGRGRAVY